MPPGKYAAIEVIYSGKPADGEKLIAPLAKLGKPLLDGVSTKPYVLAQLGATGSAPPALPAGSGFYVKSGFLNSGPDSLVSEIIMPPTTRPNGSRGTASRRSPERSRVKPHATAYWNRMAQWIC